MVDQKEVEMAYAEYEEQKANLRKKEEDYAWEDYCLSKIQEITNLYIQTQQEIEDYFAESEDENFRIKKKGAHALKRKNAWKHRKNHKILSLRHRKKCADRVCAAKARCKEDDRIFRTELVLITN